tara:strand:+ start:594 stop:779 length:186 start_codon:yes stop_codon:yes gene_type:complete
MRCKILALALTPATQVDADCGILCDGDWWNNATATSLRAESHAGAPAKSQDEKARSPWGYA